ncbi:MAG: polysaccharide deacetylase family protein [Desulfosporosinus sp.]
MLKIIKGMLLSLVIVCGLLLGISGCGVEKPSIKLQEDSSSLKIASQALTNKTDSSDLKNPAETSNESSNNTPRSTHVQDNQVVPILYYHSIMQESGNELRMPPEQFELQMAYLKDNGYQSVSLKQLYQALYKGGTLPAKPFVITFDDGYVDNYTNAFPILKKYGFTATVFMVTSYINGEGFLSWSQLKELAANGWEIEGHTANHPYLTKLAPSTLLSELNISKELLENELKQPVNFFAYPYGDLNDDVVQVLKDTGYLMAVTTERGWADGKEDAWHLQRVYCYASMGINEFKRRMQNPNY